MNILLSYSKAHFDPTKPPELQKHWNSSASILARSLYSILGEIGTVTYVDRNTYKSITGLSFDLFIGITEHFSDILDICTIKKSILFAVNMHPYERNTRISSFIHHAHIPNTALAGYELIKSLNPTSAIDRADYILCVGNTETYNSYIAHGVPLQKIKMINYAAADLKASAPLSRTAKRHIVHVGSEIGIRKGFDIVETICSNESIASQDFHLDIIGGTTSQYYKEKIVQLKKILGDKMTYHGWIDSTDATYANIIARNDFLIYPTLEEGQAGSVLECLGLGVIPLVSTAAGIDFSPLGLLETKTESPNNIRIVTQALKCSDTEVIELKTKTLEYYHELHAPFKETLARSINDCIADELYPLVSIVLSIFNKQETIIPLLKHLVAACTTYGNTEIQIIFDGCTDKSEELVRAFFIHHPKQRVIFHVTDNIWEVKSNNLGLRASNGRYVAIIQDDNFVYDNYFLFELVQFFEKNPTAAIIGGLAGVNFYPRGTTLPQGPGQTASNADESYWRQDATTDPALVGNVFEVDACMRGPLAIRTSFLETYGYLDEIYAPLYNDDMDLCFRARSHNYKVYCMLLDVENKNGTVAHYDAKKAAFFQNMITRNAAIFYTRWTPSTTKNYLRILRIPITKTIRHTELHRYLSQIKKPFSLTVLIMKKIYQLLQKNINQEGFWSGIRKTVSMAIRKTVRYWQHLPHYVMRFARFVYSSPEDSEYIEREKRERPWYQINGDETLRVEYDLNPSSLVIDIGGYKGDWASIISNKYNPTIHIFEPVRDFAFNIKRRFKNHDKVIIHEAGLGATDETITIYLAEGGTSLIKEASHEVVVSIQDIHTFMNELDSEVDLMKINIEGAEYDLLARLIETGDIKRIKNIQVQFHNFVPNAKDCMEELHKKLSVTHHPTYQYEFIWENWERNS